MVHLRGVRGITIEKYQVLESERRSFRLRPPLAPVLKWKRPGGMPWLVTR